MAATTWLGVDVGAVRKGFDYAVTDRAKLVELRGQASVARIADEPERRAPSELHLRPKGRVSRSAAEGGRDDGVQGVLGGRREHVSDHVDEDDDLASTIS